MPYVGKLPEKYEPQKIEEEILKFWEEQRVYEKIRAMSKDKPKFYFLDGPPYPSSGTPHIGTVWNKVIKDVIIRHRRLKGFNVRDQPGYDTHGLPIEVAAEKTLGLESKKDIVEKVGVEKFIKTCKSLALNNAKEMSRHFNNVGVSMNWQTPYYTLDPKYIELAWWMIKKAHERGLLTKGLKVVHWCPRCETVLADYEVSEYKDLEDPSIYVKFPIEGKENEYILVWTTTPWTLPANVAVMVNPNLDYVKVEYKGEKYILVKDRLNHVFKEELKDENYKVLETFKGAKLEGLRYIPPLLDEVYIQKKLHDNPNTHRVVLSEEYVSPYEGTGCVHSAPGHGHEDYEVSLRYNLPVVSPVNSQGVFTEEAGKYKGMKVKEANKYIIEDLKRKGLLLHATTIIHKYPVCWRCKTPLIIRATEQWYIKVTELKDKIISEAEKAKWIPEWALDRFKNWLKNLRDWVISRQRYWGTPIPIWECKNCGHMEVVGSLKELKRLSVEDIELKDLHKPWVDHVKLKCPKCGGVMERVPDVLDVWFDSGIAFYASLGSLEAWDKLKPVDFIVEGHDQIAGWFFSLLRAGVIGFDSIPYKVVLVHGFMLDEKGREMHKSLGNYVSPDEVIEKYGRDTLRFWVTQSTVWEDIRFNWRALNLTFKDLNIVWNVYLFASTYMNLDKFDPNKYKLEELRDKLSIEDQWLLSKFNSLLRDVDRYLGEYRIHEAARQLRNFIVEDVSHWYLKLIRRKVWIEEESIEKITTYTVLYRVLKDYLKLLSIFTPFIAEKIYQEMFKPAEQESPLSIHMESWPKVDEEFIDKTLEDEMEVVRKLVEASLSARMKAGVKLRQPLPALHIITTNYELFNNIVGKYEHIIKSQANVKQVHVRRVGEGLELRRFRVEPKYSVIGPMFKRETSIVVKGLEEHSEEAARSIISTGKFELVIDGKKYVITKEMVNVVEEPSKDYAIQEFEHGTVALEVRISEEEYAEGLARDIVRRVQFMRKEMNLPVDAFIDVVIVTPDEKLKAIVESKRSYISYEVRASTLNISCDIDKSKLKGYIKTWDIDGESFTIAITNILHKQS